MKLNYMKNTFLLLLVVFIFLNYDIQINAQSEFEFLLDDFFTKQNEALSILKEIELDLKNGTRNQVCRRQRKAARLGILANKSLIKAYQLNDSDPPMELIEASKKKWYGIIEDCF